MYKRSWCEKLPQIEDRMMVVFDEYFNRCDNKDTYDELCNNIIFIYYENMEEVVEGIIRMERGWLWRWYLN